MTKITKTITEIYDDNNNNIDNNNNKKTEFKTYTYKSFKISK